MMQPSEVGILASTVLREKWRLEIERVDVDEHEDHFGDEALFLKALLKEPAVPIAASKFYEGQLALIDALSRRGETRYPYLEAVNPESGIGQLHLRATIS